MKSFVMHAACQGFATILSEGDNIFTVPVF